MKARIAEPFAATPSASPTDQIHHDRAKSVLPRDSAAVVVCLAVVAAALLIVGRHDYPELHTILDTSMFVLSAILALLLRDIGLRMGRAFPLWLAASFGVTAILDFAHVMVTVEWWGVLAPIAESKGVLRPSTWPPSVHVLPLSIGASIWLLRRGGKSTPLFLPGIALLAVMLFEAFQYLPTYTPPTLFGITRPALVLAPLLWLAVGLAAWHWRDAERKLRPLACMAAILVCGNIAMLYSQAPHDTPAMVAHLAKTTAFLVMLLSLMRMASLDMRERIQAERELARLNEELEARVFARTTELNSTNRTLEIEAAVRGRAEQRALAQLQRLNLLHQITRAIGERQDLASIFQVAIRSVEDELPADFCCLCLHDEVASELNVAGIGTKSMTLYASLALSERAKIKIDANGLSRCLQGALVYESDLGGLDFPFPRRLAQGGLGSVVFAPLQVESSVFGILIVGRGATQAFNSGECEFLRQLSGHVALATHQAQLYGALQQAYDDLRQTQQTVMQQERLRALGQMASGIAHDINNSLTPASLYTESLLEDVTLGEDARATLTTIHRAIEDVAHTVARMKEFYHHPETEANLSAVALNDLVRQVVDLTRASWSDMAMQRGAVIAVSLDLAPELPQVMGLGSEIREALINLVLNAVDAVPNGGKIELRTGIILGGSGPSADRVRVEIADNGAGMNEETRLRCLEPFFTTKGERGTGLGLAMVYGVTQRHRAEIEIDSTPGRGTTMRLLFPAADAGQSSASAQAPELRPATRLNLLLVDDDPLLLKAMRDILETDGHVVEAMNGGQAGIDAFRTGSRAGRTYAAVITDLGMPNVDGRKVAAAIKAVSSTTPVILLTGWGQRLIAEGDIPPHVDLVLSKPPNLRDLRRALAQLCQPTA